MASLMKHMGTITSRLQNVFLTRSNVSSTMILDCYYTSRSRMIQKHNFCSTKQSLKNETVTLNFVLSTGEKLAAEGKIGENLLDVIIDNDLDIDGFGACEGTLACSTCHLIFKPEQYEKLIDKPTDEELDMLDLAYGLEDTIKSQRARTGGGPPPPSLSNVEESLIKNLEGRPGVEGLSGSVDSDGIVNLEREKDAEAGPSLSVPTDIQCGKEKRGKHSRSEERQNLVEDTERIKLCQKKLKLEIICLEKKEKKIDAETNLINLQNIYYQFKLQKEFGSRLGCQVCVTKDMEGWDIRVPVGVADARNV